MGRRITAEFRAEAVRLALTSGLTRNQAASDLGIARSTLSRWLREHRVDEGQKSGSPALMTDMEAELARLRKENRILKEEREILKKATQYFARVK